MTGGGGGGCGGMAVGDAFDRGRAECSCQNTRQNMPNNPALVHPELRETSLPPTHVMPSANRALLASSLLLCAVACAAVALLTIASSATEQLARPPRLPVLASTSSISALEARVESDSKAAAAKDAGAKALQAQLIKYAFASPLFPTDRLHALD
jgi:hypothetical protein